MLRRHSPPSRTVVPWWHADGLRSRRPTINGTESELVEWLNIEQAYRLRIDFVVDDETVPHREPDHRAERDEADRIVTVRGAI